MANKNKRFTWTELYKMFSGNVEDDGPLYEAYIVYKDKQWPGGEHYSLKSRTYVVSSGAKYFDHTKGGRSLFGSNLDCTDNAVRLDWYKWDIEYCYMSIENYNQLKKYLK